MTLTQEAIRELQKTQPMMTEDELVHFIGQFDSVEDMQKKVAQLELLRDTAQKCKVMQQ